MQSRGCVVALCLGLLCALPVMGKESQRPVDDADLAQEAVTTRQVASVSGHAPVPVDTSDRDHQGIVDPTVHYLAARNVQQDDQTSISTEAREDEEGEESEVSDVELDDQLSISTEAREGDQAP